MKKSCEGCRAHLRTGCALNYKTEIYYRDFAGFKVPLRKPLQECEKPKTYNDFLTLLKNIKSI